MCVKFYNKLRSLGLGSEEKREEEDEAIKEKRQEGAVNNVTKADSHSLNHPKASQNKPWLNLSEQVMIKYIKARHEDACINRDTLTKIHTQNIKQQKLSSQAG